MFLSTLPHRAAFCRNAHLQVVCVCTHIFGTHCFEVRESLSRAALHVFAQNWIQKLFAQVGSITFLKSQSDVFMNVRS